MNVDKTIIDGIVARSGRTAARHYARQTLRIYRRAVLNPAHFASTTQYRRAFIVSYLFYKHYLQTHIAPHTAAGVSSQPSESPATKDPAGQHIAECERRIDAELDGTFPASDPPSWTLGVDPGNTRFKH